MPISFGNTENMRLPQKRWFAQTAMRTTPIFVKVATFETRRKQEGLRVTTVSGMAALRQKMMTVIRMATPKGHPCDC